MPQNTAPKITIGCDPEIFLRRKSDNKLVSAHDLIPGTKAVPYKVEGGAIQVDGIAAEFNTNPADNWRDWYNNIGLVRTQLQAMLPHHTFSYEPAVMLDKDYFETLPDGTKLLGCDPDFNAWTGQVNPPPNGKSLMRTGAGHIHVGWTQVENPMSEVHFEECRTVVRQLDYYLGVPSILWDTDNRRREMYGKAGAFRPKPYGVEYRTPSNAWLRHDRLWPNLFTFSRMALEGLITGSTPEFFTKYGDQAQKVIDGNNREEASNLHKLVCSYAGLDPIRW